MSSEELIAENDKLKERIAFLEKLVNRGSSGNTRAYNAIRMMIIEKTEKEVPLDIIDGKEKNWTRREAERQVMRDLKWDLHIRTISDFRDEHIESAKEYIEKYVFAEKYKKSRWA